MATKAKKPAVKAKAPAPVKRKAGRPTLYKPEYCELATNYCLLGATDAELAGYFKVDERTINEWKTVHEEFSQSIYDGRDKADAHIAKALYHRAKGYAHSEDDIRVVAGSIEITPTTKHYPPDTAAASLWLRNRQRHRWTDKVEIEHGGSLRLDQLPDAVLQERMAEMLARLANK